MLLMELTRKKIAIAAATVVALMGVGTLFGPGTPTSALVDYIKDWFAARHQDA